MSLDLSIASKGINWGFLDFAYSILPYRQRPKRRSKYADFIFEATPQN